MADKLYSQAEAARRLGVSLRTVNRWVASGEIKAVKVGPRFHRVPASEITRKLGGKP